MKTPICDFVQRYEKEPCVRLHMPGHKGVNTLGIERRDITEIAGADSLYEADGIIRESEQNAGMLFGAHTYYSTEGSSLCIRAMLYMTALYARSQGKTPRIAAARNVHKSFVSAAAVLDIAVDWVYAAQTASYLSCRVDAAVLDACWGREEPPTALYITSPDYVGQMADIAALSRVCHKHGVLLLVDNAHGAYLKFLPQSCHPMDLGADLCCDSAHKTLPALTGAAYLHVSPAAPSMLTACAKRALALFGSTSPSYLILQSLDALNRYLSDGYSARLAAYTAEVGALAERLCAHGYALCGDEPLKLTLCPKSYGYTGTQLAALLAERGIVCEFADPDFTVLMFTPENGAQGIARTWDALRSVPRREAIDERPPVCGAAQRVLSLREATLCDAEEVPAAASEGRILAATTVSCPPAVPPVMCGERIDASACRVFAYYGIQMCTVIKE